MRKRVSQQINRYTKTKKLITNRLAMIFEMKL